jgi:uncharacterized protein
VSAEPRVDQILASIRESMDGEPEPLPPMPRFSGQSISHQEQGTLMRGAMREMRVSYDTTAPIDKREIEDLRERIRRHASQTAVRQAPQPTHYPAPPAPRVVDIERNDGFGGILTGKAEVREPAPPPQPRKPAYAYQRPRYAPAQVREELPISPEPATDEQLQQLEQEIEAYLPAPRAPRRPLLSNRTEQAARTSFEELADVILSRAGGERSMEDMTRDMLRGLLRTWLDENLPDMVEKLVREEIQRVARST